MNITKPKLKASRSKRFAAWSNRTKIIVGILVIASLGLAGFVTYSVVDCLTTSCVSTNDQAHAAIVRSEALSYSRQDCYKSYKQAACNDLYIHDASFSCGFMGFCGWIANVEGSKGFFYNSGVTLTDTGPHHTYIASSYSEDDTPYTQKVSALFSQICLAYKPTSKLGCTSIYISPTIDWLGNNNQNPAIGVASSSLDPYSFRATIDRSGSIFSATITNYDNDADTPVYVYKATE